MRVILQADQRPRQNHKDEILPAHPQEQHLLEKELVQSPNNEVSKKLIHLLRHGSLPRENDGAIEFWRSKTIFRNISCIVTIGLTKSGRKAWQEEEETGKDTSIVLIHQEQCCTSELFKAIQDAVSLILINRTMSLFRAASFNTFIMSDVQSIYFHHQFGIDTGRSKFWATDRQYSFCLWIPHGQKT